MEKVRGAAWVACGGAQFLEDMVVLLCDAEAQKSMRGTGNVGIRQRRIKANFILGTNQPADVLAGKCESPPNCRTLATVKTSFYLLKTGY